jgi:SnoaL-like polyketide cyclase
MPTVARKGIVPYAERGVAEAAASRGIGRFLSFSSRHGSREAELIEEGSTMSAKTSEEARNEGVIRTLYSLAEGNSKNTSAFVSQFTDDGYFYDVGAGKKYFGPEIGLTVDVYAAAFPDMHRELYSLRSFGDHVLVELSLNGTHKGDLVIPPGTIPSTGKQIHAPCCDVFRLKDGKVFSFHCYVAVPILLEQLGVFMNLQASLRR